VRRLGDAEAFAIPAGQFAFLMTEETVTVGANALAFISMRAGTKFRGLVNVSGFHVDPGYHGKLLFAVFNAGPVSVHLKQGDPCFLIWYADLDAVSEQIKSGTQLTAFPVERINAISGELHSFEGLSKKLKDAEKGLGDRVHALERESALYKIVATLLLGLAVTYVGALIKDYVSKHDAAPSVPAAQTPAATAPSPPAPVQQSPSGSSGRP
ncbi:MAG TPA: hypothetical protein VGY54_05730, partial [Polyangiaceae bacterium]|nr:hypothetical protein [Polyangiaceae bacterium]